MPKLSDKFKKIFSIEKKDIHIKFIIFGIKISFIPRNLYRMNFFYIKDEKGVLHRRYKDIKGVKINFSGVNAKIILSKGYYSNCIFNVGSNSILEIDKPHKWGIKNLTVFNAENSYIHIGENFNCAGARLISLDKNMKINIGKNCMFSYNVEVRTHDGHVIYDKITKQAINQPKNITIENNCWIGTRAIVMKGVNIANNSIIGAQSLVNKNIEEENTISAGVPSKIIKRNIGWDRESFSDYVALNKKYRR